MATGSVLATDRGPLTVTRRGRYQGRHLVRFEGVADRAGAEALRGPRAAGRARWSARARSGSTSWSEPPSSRRDGAELGVVEAVEANPASDLLVLDGGGLVPLRFVVSHEPGSRVVVDVPEGLLD